eukprot:1499460-Amphidinium_carterae.1
MGVLALMRLPSVMLVLASTLLVPPATMRQECSPIWNKLRSLQEPLKKQELQRYPQVQQNPVQADFFVYRSQGKSNCGASCRAGCWAGCGTRVLGPWLHPQDPSRIAFLAVPRLRGAGTTLLR